MTDPGNSPSDDAIVHPIGDDPIAQALQPRPNFISISPQDLSAALIEQLPIPPSDQDAWLKICAQLQSFFHVEHQAILLRMEQLYERLDPDSGGEPDAGTEQRGTDQREESGDTRELDSQHRDQLTAWLFDHLAQLLYSAHYQRLSRAELERAIDVGWQWGVRLEVDFEMFSQLEIFARGYQTVTITRRRWQNLFRKESVELPEFTRLILAFRIRPEPDDRRRKKRRGVSLDPNCVYLKTFKNIPETDLEILLPGSRIRLTRLDRAKILLPTVSGMAITGYKLFRSALLLGLAFSWKTWFGFAVLIGGGVGYLVKSVLRYFQTRENYQSGLTKSLYLKNLDNNLSVLYRILAEAEEQEVSEAILAYGFLWQCSQVQDTAISPAVLDSRVEAFLEQETEADVDFDVQSALAKLARLGLARVNSDGNWSVMVDEPTDVTMRRNWERMFDQSSQWFPRGPAPSTEVDGTLPH